MESNSAVLIKRNKVAGIIRSERLKQNISQRELADASGCSRSTIIRIEDGVFSPNADQLYAIFEALDIKLTIGKHVV